MDDLFGEPSQEEKIYRTKTLAAMLTITEYILSSNEMILAMVNREPTAEVMKTYRESQEKLRKVLREMANDAPKP